VAEAVSSGLADGPCATVPETIGKRTITTAEEVEAEPDEAILQGLVQRHWVRVGLARFVTRRAG
jgi:hypothetical protein